MGVFDIEKDDDKTINFVLLALNIVKEENKYKATLFCGQSDGKVNDSTIDFKEYREIPRWLWKNKVGWSHKSFVSFLDKDSKICFIWNNYKDIQKTAQMIGKTSCNEVLQNIDALLISSNKFYDTVYEALSEIDIKLLGQKQKVNSLKEENEDFVSIIETDDDFKFSVTKGGINRKYNVRDLYAKDKEEIENLPMVCTIYDKSCEVYGKTMKDLIQFFDNKTLLKQYHLGLYNACKEIVPNHIFLNKIKEDYKCGQLNMTAYIANNQDGEHLAMVCNQDGDLAPAKIKVQDAVVTHMYYDGKYHKVNGIELDSETAQYGKLWKFNQPFKLGLNMVETVRVVDIVHNMFEIVDGKGVAPSSVKDATLEKIESCTYTAAIPVFINDWGKRDFNVVGMSDRQKTVMPQQKVRKITKLKTVDKASVLSDSDMLDFE